MKMTHLVRPSLPLILLLASSFPVLSQADNVADEPVILAIGPNETATIYLTLALAPAASGWDDLAARVGVRFLAADGSEVGSAEQDVRVVGFGTFSVKHRPAASNGASELVVNGEVIGLVNPDATGRLPVRLEFSLGRAWNTATGEAFEIPASQVPGFKAGKELKDGLNGTIATGFFDISIRPPIDQDAPSTQPRARRIVLSHAIGETADVLIAAGDLAGLQATPALLTTRLAVQLLSPYVANTVDLEMPSTGIGTFTIEAIVEDASNASLLINGTHKLCCVGHNDGSVAYPISLDLSKTVRRPLTGETVRIDSRIESNAAVAIYDRETGRSRGFGFVEMPNQSED
jgi:nucleoid DNA-binding protein